VGFNTHFGHRTLCAELTPSLLWSREFIRALAERNWSSLVAIPDGVVRVLAAIVIVAGLYWKLRGWARFNEETGLNLVRQLRRDSSPEEIAAVGDQVRAARMKRIQSLRERAASDPRAARQLARLLENELSAWEGVLRQLQSSDRPFSEAAKKAAQQEALQLRGMQQEIRHLPGA
jgi:hypothetical protein